MKPRWQAIISQSIFKKGDKKPLNSQDSKLSDIFEKHTGQSAECCLEKFKESGQLKTKAFKGKPNADTFYFFVKYLSFEIL